MIKFVENEKIDKYTTYQIGGNADLFISVSTIKEFEEALSYSWKNDIPFFILGKGSNILVSDQGFRGLVIQNNTRTYKLNESNSNATLFVESGVVLDEIVRITAEKGWAGLEWGVRIPGTIGGAVITNAGTTGGSISDSIDWITVLCKSGEKKIRHNSELRFGYRDSIYRQDWNLRREQVILNAQFNLKKGERDELCAIIKRRIERRNQRQPKEPNVGSIFKNPPNGKVRELIEQLGLKGYRIGNAQISEIAPSFIINLGGATSEDVLGLILLMKKRVNEHFKIELETEVEIIGDWSNELKNEIEKLYNVY